jgi:ribosome-associated heat shock protein Hsp15
MNQADTQEAVRIDIWFWRARFFKTRKLSAEYISKRGVRLTRNGLTRKVTKPGASLARGDVVTFGRAPHIKTVKVLEFGVRRGPASEAAFLYLELEEGA